MSPCNLALKSYSFSLAVSLSSSRFLLSLSPCGLTHKAEHRWSWLLRLRPLKAAWERTWRAPSAATCSGSLSCWPVCTTSANPASPGTGGGLRGLWPAHSAARSSAPSSFKLTTWWRPWWRRSGSPPRTLTSKTSRWVQTSCWLPSMPFAPSRLCY